MSESNNPFPTPPPPPESRSSPFTHPPAAVQPGAFNPGAYKPGTYGAGPRPPGVAADSSKVSGLAITGFVLGLCSIVLFFTAVVPILAVVFGLVGASAVKDSNGARTGLKMARAGWILGVLGVAGFAAIIVVAIVADDSESTLDELEIGSCYDLPIADEFVQISTLERVPCADPHRGEFFFQYDMNSDHNRDYPGQDEILVEAGARCTADPWLEYVGLDYDKSIYDVFLIVPVELNWKNGGAASCFVIDASGGTLTGSARDTGQ